MTSFYRRILIHLLEAVLGLIVHDIKVEHLNNIEADLKELNRIEHQGENDPLSCAD